ncbi:MAG: hypothetical protein M3452_08780, partial [Chloroflexota bacterium]|nr:hypothetical protein [Chloroflexota bacterium]
MLQPPPSLSGTRKVIFALLVLAGLLAVVSCTSARPLATDGGRSPAGPSIPPVPTTAPVATSSTSSHDVTAAPVDGPPTWAALDDAALSVTDGELRDVLVGGPGLVAVGATDNGTEGGSAAIWTSIDGSDWDTVALEGAAATGRLLSVTVGGPGFVAVGGECCPDRAAVWISGDGLAWQRVEDQESFDGAVMTSITSWAGGLVAVGCIVDLECTGTAIWTSSNGADWERVSLGTEIGAAYLRDITASGAVLVAVGASDQGQPGPPAIFVSLDAQAWTRADVPSVPVSLTSVTAGPDGIVAVGSSLDEVSGQPVSVVLTSPDGASWSTVSSDRFARAVAEDVVVGTDG